MYQPQATTGFSKAHGTMAQGLTFDSFELRLAQRVNFHAGVGYLHTVLQYCNG